MMKGLLDRQLASITDTLARASQRRDMELQQKVKPKSPPTSTIQVPSPVDLSLISDTEGTSSNSGDSIVFDGQHRVPSIKNFSVGKSHFDRSQDDSTACGSLPGGYASDDKDSRKLLADIGLDAPSIATRHDTYSKQKLMSLHQLSPGNNVHDMNDPKKMLVEMLQVDSGYAWEGHNVSPPLADRDRVLIASTVHDYKFDPRQSTEELRSGDSTIGEVSLQVTNNDGLRNMLADLEGRTPAAQHAGATSDSEDDDPRAMLASLERKTPRLTEEPPKEDNEDLTTLHNRLMVTLSPEPAIQSPALEVADDTRSEVMPDPMIVSDFVATQFENAGAKCEKVQGRTTNRFSNSLDGYKAQQEMERAVKLADEKLNKLIQYTLAEEERWLVRENLRRLPRRILVSNIAADAGVDDLAEFFFQHRSVVKEFKILASRDPLKRTQIAHVDMRTRSAAIEASYMTGSIFGLVLHIRLAVEKDD